MAADYLAQLGYQVLERNYRAAGGEIDLVAMDGEVLCFVEVKARENLDHGDPLEAIDRKKISRVVGAAKAYLGERDPSCARMRFDALGIVLSQPPSFELVREAFDAS